MSTRKNKRKSHKGRIFLIILFILICIGLIFRFVVYPKVMDNVTEQMGEIITQEMDNNGEDIDQMIDSMDEKDKERVEEILTDKISPSAVKEVSGYIKNNDSAGLKEFAEKNLSESEKNELLEIYSQYN